MPLRGFRLKENRERAYRVEKKEVRAATLTMHLLCCH